MATTDDTGSSWRRLTGLGFELFGIVFGCVLVGTWIDRSYDTSPRGVLVFAVLGIVGGLYNVIRSALAALETSDSPRSAGEGDAAGKKTADRPGSTESDGRADGR